MKRILCICSGLLLAGAVAWTAHAGENEAAGGGGTVFHSVEKQTAVDTADFHSVENRAPAEETIFHSVENEKPVYLIPIRGPIENALLYVIRRGLLEARENDARAIVFVMDTPGGTLDAASDIVRSIQSLSVPTYTFVEKNAYSAGAIIALATDRIYMAPGSVIGDALPISVSPWGGVQEMPEAYQEKAVSAVSALIRAAAQKSGHNPELAEKMVRREEELTIGDRVISPAGQLLTLTNQEAEEILEDGRPLLSMGTVENVEALLETIQLAGVPIQEMVVTRAEKVARWIAAMAPILMMIGFLCIYIEFKTPGFGVFGIIGLCALALFFWGHHIAGLSGMEDVLAFVVGLVLVGVEIFLTPGFGVIGLLGIGLVGWSLVSAMVRMVPGEWSLPTLSALSAPLLNLSWAIIGTAAGIFILAKFLPKSPLGRRLILSTSASAAEGYLPAPDHSDWIGLTGTAWTDLRPSGVGHFAEEGNMDVMTSGIFIEKGTPIVIVAVHGQRIVVDENSASTSAPSSSTMGQS